MAANSDDILRTNLLRSGEADLAKEIVIKRNAPSAAMAYNAAMADCTGDVVVLAHQDVFLPAGWAKKLCHGIKRLTERDPQWGVTGVYGVTTYGKGAGYVYSTGLRRFVGEPFTEPIQVRSLDEMLLVLRRSADLRFDERLPGFHLYGTDICLEAEVREMRNYALPCFALHNSCGVKWLPMSFWQAYIYLRRKWKDRLPVVTPCTEITAGCTPIVNYILTAGWLSVRGRNKPSCRMTNPENFYVERLAPTVSQKRLMHILKNKKIILLGATFSTSNMGVGALTAGTIKCILHRFPDAEIFLLDYGREKQTYDFQLDNRVIPIQLLNMRFSKKIYLKNNIAVLLLLALALRLIPSQKIRNSIISKNLYLKHISESDIAASIAGGDSFSDIYGLGRLFYVSLPQLLVLFMGKNLVLLPQTLGPFKGRLARVIARYILNRADVIYSRDYTGIEEMRKFLSRGFKIPRVRFCYDVGFALDPVKPDNMNLGAFSEKRTDDSCVVGLNISGLLFMGGYTQNNMFGLKIDYRELIYTLIDRLMQKKKVMIVLVPHVFGSLEHLESDSVVCAKIYDELKTKYKDRLFLAQGYYNQNEIKYVIGLCDFFIGSRMHACIAALSQNIPAVAIAYSKKFFGVLQTIGAESLVVDPRAMDKESILTVIDEVYENRDSLKEKLQQTIPQVKKTVLNLFSK